MTSLSTLRERLTRLTAELTATRAELARHHESPKAPEPPPAVGVDLDDLVDELERAAWPGGRL